MNRIKDQLADKARMLQWLLLALLAYLIAMLLAQMPAATDAGMLPRLQVVLWKIGHLTLSAWVGYWIDRAAFPGGRLPDNDFQMRAPDLFYIRRAIVIAATMLAFGMAI